MAELIYCGEVIAILQHEETSWGNDKRWPLTTVFIKDAGGGVIKFDVHGHLSLELGKAYTITGQQYDVRPLHITDIGLAE